MESKAMLPDSTQSETVPVSSLQAPEPSSAAWGDASGSNTKGKKKKKKKRKSEDRNSPSCKKKKLSKEKSHKEKKTSKKSTKDDPDTKRSSDPIEPADSDVDLVNNLKPIRDYIKDREVMLQHMFHSVIKANKLQAMLPDILKGLNMEELKSSCLKQLEGMSKSRIASILAGEEMHSSSEEDSDSDIEKGLSKTADADDVINSEVIDSTSILPRASPGSVDVEESISVHEGDEEAAGEEVNEGDSDAENDAEYKAADSADEMWQDENEREPRCSEDEDEVEEEMEQDVQSNAEEEVEGRDIPEEIIEVKKPKKFRRIKIVQADGEEFEEGELTSDEVETDEESVQSTKEETDKISRPEADTQDDIHTETHHGAVPGERKLTTEHGDSEGHLGSFPKDEEDRLTNSGNQGAYPDVGDANGSVLTDEKTNKEVIPDDTLNVLAEDDNFEIDAEETGKLGETDNDVNASDHKSVGQVDERDSYSDDDVIEVDIDIKSDNDNNGDDNEVGDVVNKSKTDTKVASFESDQKPPQPPQPCRGAPGAAKTAKSGRKVAQELEVLELELRARAIRSLMKQYRKDVG